MSLFLIDNQYFGCVNWTGLLFNETNIKIEQFDCFEKMSFRNRCVILGGNGPIHLSVPIAGGRNKKQLAKEVRIDNKERWQKQHWRTIVSCYGRSPFFEFYSHSVEKFFLKEYSFLWDLNWDILQWLIKMLKVKHNIGVSDSYEKVFEGDVVDCRNRWMPKNFQQENAGIRYKQVFEDKVGFQPNISILDLLFCEGPNAANLLSQFSYKPLSSI
jgi:hypothetical protein